MIGAGAAAGEVMAAAGGTARGAGQRIWDLPLRLCHWALVAAVTGSFASHYAGGSAFRWHVRCGWLTLGLVLFRLAWAFAGTRYARFAEFVQRPAAPASAGHTRLGGWMALALLALLGAQAAAGLFANDDLLDSGPLSALAGRALSDRLSTWHVAISKLLWFLLPLHVAAAIYYRVVRRDDRVRALVTGDKRGLAPGTGIEREHRARALAIAALIAAALAALAVLAPPPLELDD